MPNMNSVATAELLEKVGFRTAAGRVSLLALRKRKLAIAYEHYRYVRPEKVAEFNKRLKAKTIKGKEPYDAEWQTLAFQSIESYNEVPPLEVLTALAEAQDRNCFDSYEIAYIANVKDPILFARISECADRFFIAQWDDDVRIEDILAANEG